MGIFKTNYLEEDNTYLKDLNKLIDSLELGKIFKHLTLKREFILLHFILNI